MSSKYKEDSYVVCPRYKKECSTEIRCEGLCSSITTHVFPSGKKKEAYKDDFCRGYYWNCEHVIALENKEEYEHTY